MRTARLTLWILASILVSTACHGPETEVEQETATTTAVEKEATTTEVEKQLTTTEAREQQSTTTKVEECSWCPAPEPSGTTTPHPPALNQADLTDRLRSAAGGTAFAEISEDQLLSDIRTICETWKGDTSLEDAASRASQARAELLGVSESDPGFAPYTQLLETSADQRCLRDPTQ